MENRKQLIIVRHGKSSWKYDKISDIDRHLKERGIHDAYTMAERVKEKAITPDLILSSPATRALHTAMIFTRTLNHPLEQVQLQDIFYQGNEQDVLDVIRHTSENVSTLMIFGHNPTFTDLANLFLTGELDNLPTAGMAFLELEAARWQEIEKEKVVREWTDSPKNKY